MVINNVPRLACKTFCNELLETSSEIKIEPLSKFPCIQDLKVDRTSLFKAMEDMHLWLDENAKLNYKKVPMQYTVSECLMCGCCLEACANYKSYDIFKGAVAAVNALKILEQLQNKDHKNQIKKDYKEKVFNECSNSLACEKVCPMNIPINHVMSKMNRYSVWRVWQLISGR